VALADRGDDSATTGAFVSAGEAVGLAAVGVGEATAVVAVAVLSTDNPACGSLVWPCPGRG
jgi:hypothetical protein